MTDLSIIIVSYNTVDFLKNCLASVFEHGTEGLNTEVVVIDNASADDSVAMVKKDFPKVHLIENKENAGFSKANNIGVRKAKGRYILFLNSDTKVPQNTLQEMVHFMDEHPQAGAATCFVKLADSTLDDAAHRGFPTPWNAFSHFSGLSKLFANTKLFGGYNLSWMNLESIHEIDALAGAFMLVRREAGEQVGWWDEDYFFYGEDLDFCYNLKQKGWKVYFVPDVSITHYKGVSSGIKEHSENLSTATKEKKRFITHARFEAMRIFYKKHYTDKYPTFVTWLVMQGISLKEKLTLQKYQ